MCGIFGILLANASDTPDPKRILRATESLRHRGPDAVATHCQPGVGLGHTRLSFVDLDARSNQPFWDGSRRY